MGVSLAKFDTKTKATEGLEIELRDFRTGEGAGAFVTILGQDSDAYRNAHVELLRARAGAVSVSGREEATQAEIEGDVIELLARCTVGWRNLDGEDGQPLVHSHEAAIRLHRDFPLIREQIDLAIGNRRSFLMA